MLYGLDPLYLVLALPGILLGMWAQWRVRSAFARWSRVPVSRGMSGRDVAAAILRVNGITDVGIEPTRGFLGDHYDPRSKTLRLSPDVYDGRSVAAAGVAAHEVGHAIQDARGYFPLKLRSGLVPVLSITSRLAGPILMVGFLLLATGTRYLGQTVIEAGALLFATVVVFQLVTLPVELDASRRALQAIETGGIVTRDEYGAARQVLFAAALTYVAAAVQSILQLVYFLYRAGLLGGRRRD